MTPTPSVMAPTAKSLILIVDDEPTMFETLASILEDDYELMMASDGYEALEQVRRRPPDLILLDIMMPGLSGYDVCIQLKRDAQFADIPIIFSSSLDSDKSEILGLEIGAVDYITKPINPVILQRRIANHIALKQTRDRLTRMALVDPLTGLANRRFFDQVLENECRRLSRKTSGSLSLILFDVDHFKAFNDSFGHCAGDQCLRRVADAIRSVVRRTIDVAARYGGEEFACVLPETTAKGARQLAEEVRSAILALCIPHNVPHVGAFITASFGVVTLEAGRDASPTLVIATADTLLYLAKTQGRNRVCASGPTVP